MMKTAKYQSKLGQPMPDYHTKSWLTKMGWEEGKGLGRNLEGRTDYVRVSKKDDQLGLGKSPSYNSLDFSHWDNLYNKAAQSLNISAGTEGVKLTTAVVEKPKPASVYGGMFVSATKVDTFTIETPDENGLFHKCGKSSLRIFSQEGKLKRLQEAETKMDYDAFDDYFKADKNEIPVVLSSRKRRRMDDGPAETKKKRKVDRENETKEEKQERRKQRKEKKLQKEEKRTLKEEKRTQKEERRKLRAERKENKDQ